MEAFATTDAWSSPVGIGFFIISFAIFLISIGILSWGMSYLRGR